MNPRESVNAALADLQGLILFTCKDKPLLRSFKKVLENFRSDSPEALFLLIESWAALLRALTADAPVHSFSRAVAFLTLTDDNPFTHAAESQEPIPPLVAALGKTDLSRLGRIAGFDLPGLGLYLGERLRQRGLPQLAENIEEEARSLGAAEGTPQPVFPETGDWGCAVPGFTAFIRAQGAGELGRYSCFRWGDCALKPVRHPDPVGLGDLAGYEDQRQVVIANTRRFLETGTGNNLLLYGDRGTGKSATVKAVCNEYACQGLRLLEVSKQDLGQLPHILELAASRSLRFILFIDDLSFETIDDGFTSLKMLLEGGVESKPANLLVYATSNRRHLVKERLADRPTTTAAATGDLRAFDTMEEQFSLADRFGLTVVFTAPGQEDFLRIAEHIAVQRGILKTAEFRENALRWERWFNGPSPRTAVQYVDWVAGGSGFPWET